ncbi:MAG: flavodoxin family protein [Fretibacterium sp.]|nr:flavodoxin family protein [Fretibacterium sp.]
MSKIVVFAGSPRTDGNSNAMVDSFVKAAEVKGHKVKRFDIPKMNIGGCQGCGGCYSKGRPCMIEDDFNGIVPDILAADGFIFSMPVYWFSVPSQMKALIDRFYSFLAGGKGTEVANKKYALIATCGAPDVSVAEGIRSVLEGCASLMKWKLVGETVVPGLSGKEDVLKTDGCEKAAALAGLF